MMVALVSMSFVSCSDDDDDNGSSNSSIVGTWVCEDKDDDYYVKIIFYQDGTGKLKDGYEDPYEGFSYEYFPTSNKLYMHFGDEVEIWKVYRYDDIMNCDGDVFQRVN